MKIKNFLSKKKYQTKIYLWVTFFIIITILSLSTVIYLNVEKSVLNKQSESNRLILSQMKFNIDFMDQMIKNICTSTYYSDNVRSLMNTDGKDTYEDMNTINQLNNTIVQSNPYVLSVYVYNNRKKVFYSTFNSFVYDDVDLDQLIKQYDKIPVMRPIVRKTMTYDVGDLREYSNVITYFMYEMTDSNNSMNGAVIVNIKLDWLVDNIKTINMADQSNQNQVFILDDKGEFFDAGTALTDEDKQYRTALKNAYQKQSSGSGSKDADFFKATVTGKDYMVSYIKLPETNWSILIAQPYDMVMGYINNLKTSIILITGIILVLILFAAYSISRGLYKPVEQLIRQVRTNGRKDSPDEPYNDEFAYLNKAYQSSSDQLEKYTLEKTDNINSIRLYFLRKLLIHSFSVSDEEFDRNRKECAVQLSKNEPFIVVIVRLDNEKGLQNSIDIKEKEMLKAALAKDISEIFSTRFQNEAVEMESDEFAYILNISQGEDDTAEISSMLKEAQNRFQSVWTITFTAAVSEKANGVKELTNSYNHAMDYAKYRFIFGPNSVIVPEMLKRNLALKQFDYSYKYEKQLVEDLKRHDMEAVKASLAENIQEARKLEMNDIVFSLAHLINIIKNVVYELNNSLKEPVNINTLLADLDSSQYETIDQFQFRLQEILQFVVGKHEDESQPGNKDTKLADTIKGMIEANYPDYNLNVTDLADKLKLSVSKISKAFKENMGMSIPEYINEVRLAKAVEWIENSKLNIGEIMHKIGIENESYFYRIFKVKYGTTPREYAMKKLFKQN